MARSLRKVWTAEDDEKLKRLVSSGVSVVRAAVALKRQSRAVKARARKIGCPFIPMRIARQKWASTPGWQAARRG
jgi:hypothetical protein